jgi:hypothetical protein
MLKNVQEAKFQKVLVPISRRVLSRSSQENVDFDSFFTHILSHELVHGLGPHNITVDGRETTVRHELKEIYSAIEEAKADITGLFALQYLLDNGKMPGVSKDEVEASKRRLYTTFLASSFRSMRFGIDFSKMDGAVRDLAHDLLTLEATGDYAGAKKMLEELAVLRPPVADAMERLADIPTDIEPIFVTASEVAPGPAPY